ncbi:MAG: hypothetical protein DCC67_18060 [Planctomycetota bacterium]|nr:MAG: hypothetical protein DCC67_18060 [Planctomycetota bacterium]
MDAPTSKALPAFGFLTVLESAGHGLFGGYLVLSPQGRPLEFRCTTPVVATRAQEILYGPTLQPYLLGEVIGPALLNGAELPVAALLTDQRDMLGLALVRHEELLLIEPLQRREAEPSRELALPSSPAVGGASAVLGGCRVTAAATSVLSAESLHALLEPLTAHVYLAEPFDRIRAALLEAQQATLDAAELDDDHAAAA